MPNDKENLLKYVSDTRAHYSQYHNHKETSAWAGVALHAVICAQIIFARGDFFTQDTVRWCALAFITLFSLIVFAHLSIQLRLRHIAANYVAALMFLGAERLTSVDDDCTAEKWKVSEAGIDEKKYLPPIVYGTAKRVSNAPRTGRRWLEFSAFAMVFLCYITSALRIACL